MKCCAPLWSLDKEQHEAENRLVQAWPHLSFLSFIMVFPFLLKDKK